ncbi:hypothetical protein [Actinomadura roseirufa]|uniref:hypothetical protein n=1 Tax=Actinomadura roseirufa TaxID=2094049 RepID=UPI001041131C|nr:hypothetical protein [Actinomadura roseirufa]
MAEEVACGVAFCCDSDPLGKTDDGRASGGGLAASSGIDCGHALTDMDQSHGAGLPGGGNRFTTGQRFDGRGAAHGVGERDCVVAYDWIHRPAA